MMTRRSKSHSPSSSARQTMQTKEMKHCPFMRYLNFENHCFLIPLLKFQQHKFHSLFAGHTLGVMQEKPLAFIF